jgi:hypothetical protein
VGLSRAEVQRYFGDSFNPYSESTITGSSLIMLEPSEYEWRRQTYVHLDFLDGLVTGYHLAITLREAPIAAVNTARELLEERFGKPRPLESNWSLFSAPGITVYVDEEKSIRMQHWPVDNAEAGKEPR